MLHVHGSQGPKLQLNINYVFFKNKSKLKNILAFILPAKHTGNKLWWVKLSNSGNPLKLMILNYIQKIISGWTNYSFIVIIHKIFEKIMSYRGSKSNLNLNFVKEQREDGSWGLNANSMLLRCSLKGFERNYRIYNPSKQLNRKFSTSTLNTQLKLNPYFVTGLIDGEGSFVVSIYKNKNLKLGWSIFTRFQITLHSRDLALLLQIQQFFGGIGFISKSKNKNSAAFEVRKLSDLNNIIIPHFDKFPLLSQKGADFILFKQIVELMMNKLHLTSEGLLKIINIKASINEGISEVIKSEFTNIIPVERPKIETKNIAHPSWVSGFVSGEGCFDVRILNSKTKIGYAVQLRFQLVQHERDKILMEVLTKYLACGIISKDPRGPALCLTITKLSDLNTKIITLFNNNSILGVKLLDYLDWCKVAKLMIEKKTFDTRRFRIN